jgi:transcription termination/antitermination protein NusA
MASDLNQIIDTVVKDRGVSRAVIVEALEAAMLTAARKKLGIEFDVEAQFNETLGEVELFRFREVVEEVQDDFLEIHVDEARVLDSEAQLGDSLGEKVDTKNFGRISAQMAKQVIIQKVRDAEKDLIFNEYKDRKGEIANGILRRFEKGNYIVDLGRAEGIVYQKDQIHRENYQVGERIRAYIQDVVQSSTSPQIILSRTSPQFLRMLFELEVPEISEGIVTIGAAAREPGLRAKIAVLSRDPNVDPVGACVGMKGSRVQSVVNELRGEKIDIVPYSENPAKFVCNALAPAEVLKVIIDEDSHSMQIIAADDQLSLAIGKKGQNVRLAVQLSGWKLDIQSESKWKEISEIAKSTFKRIPQIPDISADLIIKSGYMDVEELADANPEDLTRFPGISLEKANEIIKICNHILDTNEWPLPPPEEVDKTDLEQSDGTGGEVFSLGADFASKSVKTIDDLVQSEKDDSSGTGSPVEAPLAPEVKEEDQGVAPELLVDLMKLDGVGLKSSEALYKAGFTNRQKLKNVSMERLLAVPDLDIELAQKIVESMG